VTETMMVRDLKSIMTARKLTRDKKRGIIMLEEMNGKEREQDEAGHCNRDSGF